MRTESPSPSAIRADVGILVPVVTLAIRQVDHRSEAYYEALELRGDVLHDDSTSAYSATRIGREKDWIHFVASLGDRITGVVILSNISNKVARLRQLSVAHPNRGQGIGRALITHLENYAIRHGYAEVRLHARADIAGFYIAMDYVTSSEAFTEGGILHIEMRKQLENHSKSNILNTPTAEDIRRVILDDFPELEHIEAIPITSGSDYVYEVNGDLIFKFPKVDSDMIHREAAFLDLIKTRLSTQVPALRYMGKKYSYIGYTKIAGEDLYSEAFRSSSDSEKKALARDIATFLYQLHFGISIEETGAIGVVHNEDDNIDADELRQTVVQEVTHPRLREFLYDVVLQYEGAKVDKEGVVLHHDLCNANILIDPRTVRLSGIIDFGNVCAGSRYVDLSSLYRRKPSLAKQVAHYYRQISGIGVSEELIRLRAIIKEITKLRGGEVKAGKAGVVYRAAAQRLNSWFNGEPVDHIPS